MDNWYSTSYTTYPDQPVGGYIAVYSLDDNSNPVNGYDDAECSFTLPAGETLDVTINTGSWGGEAGVIIIDPSGTTTTYSGFSNGMDAYSVATLTTAGAYTIYYTDSYGDGCNPSSINGVCWVQASYTYVSGTTVPDVTAYGTLVDSDDDGDGYSDLDEGDAYDTATTALCDDGSAYASSSDSLDAASTPADMAVSYTHLTLPTICSV